MQTETVNLNDLVKKDHPYRRLLSIIDFAILAKNIANIKNNQAVGRVGYRVDACLKMLVLQFMEDLSDRELERFIAENTAAKLFCDFSLISQTPDHSLFGRLRQSIGTNNWYGYKRHVSVDMQSGLINKVAVTPANVSG